MGESVAKLGKPLLRMVPEWQLVPGVVVYSTSQHVEDVLVAGGALPNGFLREHGLILETFGSRRDIHAGLQPNDLGYFFEFPGNTHNFSIEFFLFHELGD
jgi:hypothetical protein